MVVSIIQLEAITGIIRFDISGQEWGFQYSPYAYFNEHCIFLDSKHRPMAISRQSFDVC